MAAEGTLEDLERARAESMALWRARRGLGAGGIGAWGEGLGEEEGEPDAPVVAPASWCAYAGERTRQMGGLVDEAGGEGAGSSRRAWRRCSCVTLGPQSKLHTSR